MIRKTKFIIASAFLIALTACGGTTTQTSTPTNSPEATSPSPTETPQATTPSPTETTGTTTASTDGITFKEPVKDKLNGYIDSLNNSNKPSQTIEAGKPIQLSGWAVTPDQSKPADSVLITYGDNNTVATTIPVTISRPDVAKSLKNPALEKSGWTAKLDPATLNLGGTDRIRAWSFNSQTKEAFPLGNSYEIVRK